MRESRAAVNKWTHQHSFTEITYWLIKVNCLWVPSSLATVIKVAVRETMKTVLGPWESWLSIISCSVLAQTGSYFSPSYSLSLSHFFICLSLLTSFPLALPPSLSPILCHIPADLGNITVTHLIFGRHLSSIY